MNKESITLMVNAFINYALGVLGVEPLNEAKSTVPTLLHPPTAFCQLIDTRHIYQVNLKFLLKTGHR